MKLDRLVRTVIVLAILLLALADTALASGRLEGRVTRTDGSGLPGVSVLVVETSTSTLTDAAGRFAIDGLPAGTFSVTLALGDNVLTVADVQIGNDPVRLDRTVDWTVSYADTITVYAASRKTEHLFEAPASVAIVDDKVIAREAPYGQVPRLLQSTPGVDVAQNGMFDFNVNIRGLNIALNRRVLTLFDGRDASAVLVGSQEWAAVALPIDEIARVEVVRGPASALYGANAFNGIIDITSKEPRYTSGGNAQLSVGEHATTRFSVRHAGGFADGWFYRAHAQYGRTDDFSVERTTSVEYPGLPTEISAPSVDRTEFANSGLRLDKYFAGSRALTLEGGWARTNGGVALTGAGRPQNLGVQRPFVRTAFQASQWRVSGYYDGRHGRMISLATGASTFDNSVRLHGEGQRRFAYANGRGTFVGGGALRYERTDTRDDAGISTVLRDVHANRAAALYGQIDHQVSGRLRAVMAVRFDEGTLHSPQLSPKLGMVYAISPLQRARFTYGHAFQTASFVQYFLRTPAAPSVRLGAVETALRPALGGVALNFDSVPVLALGNDRLKVEKINSVEAGYSALMGGKAMLTGDYYFNRVSDLVTSLLPQVGTSLGRINPQFGAYQPSAVLSTAQQNLVLATLRASLPSSLFAVMSNDLDGSPIFGAVSLTNYSQVHTQGAEIHLQYFASNRIAADAGYTWMHFDTRAQFPEDPLSANTAPHRVMAGATYASERMMGSLRYRWVDAFTWLSGIFRGPVPSYKVVDLAAEYRFASRIRVQLNVANLFDDKHYEVFGGDILRRSTLVTLVRQW